MGKRQGGWILLLPTVGCFTGTTTLSCMFVTIYSCIMHFLQSDAIRSFNFFQETIAVSQPFLVGQLVTYFEGRSGMSDNEAYVYGAILAVSGVISWLPSLQFYYINQIIGMDMRTACSGMIYKKVCKHFFFDDRNHRPWSIQIFKHLMSHINYMVICPIKLTHPWSVHSHL